MTPNYSFNIIDAGFHVGGVFYLFFAIVVFVLPFVLFVNKSSNYELASKQGENAMIVIYLLGVSGLIATLLFAFSTYKENVKHVESRTTQSVCGLVSNVKIGSARYFDVGGYSFHVPIKQVFRYSFNKSLRQKGVLEEGNTFYIEHIKGDILVIKAYKGDKVKSVCS